MNNCPEIGEIVKIRGTEETGQVVRIYVKALWVVEFEDGHRANFLPGELEKVPERKGWMQRIREWIKGL